MRWLKEVGEGDGDDDCDAEIFGPLGRGEAEEARDDGGVSAGDPFFGLVDELPPLLAALMSTLP